MSTSTKCIGVKDITLLGILFLGLKLTGHISWPWIWVLAPFWTPFALSLTLLAIETMIIVIFQASKK